MKQKNKYILAVSAGLLSMSAAAQNVTITGRVLDELGEPVIGATIQAGGIGTITDAQGNYSLQVADKSNLHISYIGYISQDVKAENAKSIVLKEDNQQLEEVVVVGYGAQKKAHLTGSVATVQMNDIQDLSSAGLASTLSGMMNGVSVSGGEGRPGENATISIRETSSLSDLGVTAQQPLYVIDGVIYPNDVKVGNISENLGATAFNNLDPTVIESISVLKDASAAVYGARAANGVILVTTKRGQLGAPSVSYSGSIGLTDEVFRPKMLNAYEYGRMYNAVMAADPTSTTLNRKTDLYQSDELSAMRGLNYDLLDKYWKTGITQKHGVNISGASERVSYFANVSYFTQDGNLGKLDYNRWNYRAGIDVKVNRFVKASFTLSGDNAEHLKPLVKVGGSSDEKDYNLLLTRPLYIPEEVNGHPIAAYGISNSNKASEQNYSFATLRDNGDYNETVTTNFNINGALDFDFGFWQPLKGLTARLSYSKNINNSKNNQYGSTYNIYRMTDRFGSGNHLYSATGQDVFDTSILLADDNFSPMTINNGDPSFLSRNTVRTDNYQLNFTLNYARDFGSHHVGGLFSIERGEAESEYVEGYVSGPYSFTTGQSNTASGKTKRVTTTRSESGNMSYIGRINYAYANKYLLEFLLRADASTKFAPEHMWGLFPSLSAGWILSEESWLKGNAWVDYLKLRGSWGLTGRDNTAAWQWKQVYALDANRGPVFGEGTENESDNRITINKDNASINRAVHWDKSYKMNIGVDFNTIGNRLAFSAEYYYVWNREMLMNLSGDVSTIVGTKSAATNRGEMDNYGMEFSINWRDKIGKDWKYKVGINTGYSDNKVLNMDWQTEYLYRQLQYGHRSDIGIWGLQCIGMFRSFQDIEEYFEQNHITSYLGKRKDEIRPGMLIYKDVRGPQQADGSYAAPDGVVDKDNDQVCLSKRSNNPFGFTTNFSVEWKNLSLSGQFSANWGSYALIPGDALKASNLEVTNMPCFWNADNMFSYQDVYDASGQIVVHENRQALYPNLAYQDINAAASSFWRVKNNSVRLSRLTVAYNLPKDWTKRVHIANARVNITGQNLLEFCNDYPEEFMSRMTSYGKYPTLRKWNIGLNLTF